MHHTLGLEVLPQPFPTFGFGFSLQANVGALGCVTLCLIGIPAFE